MTYMTNEDLEKLTFENLLEIIEQIREKRENGMELTRLECFFLSLKIDKETPYKEGVLLELKKAINLFF